MVQSLADKTPFDCLATRPGLLPSDFSHAGLKSKQIRHQKNLMKIKIKKKSIDYTSFAYPFSVALLYAVLSILENPDPCSRLHRVFLHSLAAFLRY